MSLDNFRNRTIIWDTVNKDFPQPIQIMQGDVNARTLLIKIVDNGLEVDLSGHSLKLTYQYTDSSNSGFVMIPHKDLVKGEFVLVIPTEMTKTGIIDANLILLNESLEQVIVSKSLTFISDNSTLTDLAQEVNNKIDDFTKLLLENMPQVMRSELNDLHAQTDSNTKNIELKANLADMTSLQNETIAKLAEKVDISDTNKFKGYFGTNFDMQMSKDRDQIHPISKFVTEIQRLKPYHLDGVFITVEVQPLRAQRLAFEANTLTTNDLQFTTLPDLTSLAQLVNLCETESIPVKGLKIHNNWSNVQWAKFDKTIWFSKYRAVIDQVIAVVPTEKIGVLNESDIIWGDTTSETNIIDLMNYLKGFDKKVTLEGTWNPLTLSTALQNAMDYFAIHAYPSLSSKRERTTFSDCLMGWSVSNIIYNFQKMKYIYPDKEIWITETGVQNLWEALRAPEDYFTPEDNTPSANNLVQTLYFDSMFQYLESDDLVSGVFMWYFDSNYSLLFEKMLRKHREGSFHA